MQYCHLLPAGEDGVVKIRLLIVSLHLKPGPSLAGHYDSPLSNGIKRKHGRPTAGVLCCGTMSSRQVITLNKSASLKVIAVCRNPTSKLMPKFLQSHYPYNFRR